MIRIAIKAHVILRLFYINSAWCLLWIATHSVVRYCSSSTMRAVWTRDIRLKSLWICIAYGFDMSYVNYLKAFFDDSAYLWSERNSDVVSVKVLSVLRIHCQINICLCLCVSVSVILLISKNCLANCQLKTFDFLWYSLTLLVKCNMQFLDVVLCE